MIVLSTLVERWYAFGFIALFFWAASAERGWRKALRFLAVAFFIEFIAEFLSTHYGFPFGSYEYIAPTRGDELYLSNVPLFVPLSFGVVVWAGRAIAQTGFRARTPGALIVVGALVAAAIDLVVDPMTLRGRSWFLGPLYAYDAGGPWFGVPWSNIAGWIGVSAVILWVDELFDAGEARAMEPIRGVTMGALIAAFFLVIALFTRHWAIFAAQAIVCGAFVWSCAPNVRRAVARGSAG
jgi:putative membrane protein